MRILQVCPTYHSQIGGVPDHVRNISERLLSRGNEVTVYATDPFGTLPRQETIAGIQVHRFKSWAPGNAYYFSYGLRRFLQTSIMKYDVVHVHLYHAFPAFYAAQARPGKRLIFTPHYHGRGRNFLANMLLIPYKHIGKRIFELARKIVCVSKYEQNLVRRDFQFCDEKITVIPNGVDLQEFESLRRKEKNGKIILYVGRLENYKGVQYLIKVLPLLENEISLEIVGTGPYRKHLLGLTRSLGVEDRVRFYQNLSRTALLQKYADSSLFALLSRYEAYSIVVAEALVAGSPCLLANTSALTEWIDNRNCFGVDVPIRMNTLAELIRDLINRSESVDTREIQGNKIIDWKEVVDRLEKVYFP